jgi:hypothetical protein
MLFLMPAGQRSLETPTASSPRKSAGGAVDTDLMMTYTRAEEMGMKGGP